MPISGLKTGLQNGLNNGTKTGFAMSNIRSGLIGGLWRVTPNRDKMLNPVNLRGTKKPLIYGLADYYTVTGGNTTVLDDLANTGNNWVSNASIANRPIPNANLFNNRTILNYDGSSSVMENQSSLGISSGEYTIMTMIKLNGTPGLAVIDTNAITAGGILVSTPSSAASACQIRSRFYSSTSVSTTYSSDVGPTNSSSVANTPAEFQGYMLLTCKFRLNQPSGAGSEQEMFINGRLHKILVGTDSFVSSNGTFTIPTIGIGNNPTAQNSLAQNFQLGMALVLPYWVQYAEQVKIENYFRWYYSYSF